MSSIAGLSSAVMRGGAISERKMPTAIPNGPPTPIANSVTASDPTMKTAAPGLP